METLKINEAIPEDYPEVGGLSPAAAALDSAALWQRIETYIVWRWTPRAVIWTVQGGGDWEPPLTPVLLNDVYVWAGNNWSSFEPDFGPLGFILPDELCKVEATVGDDEDPPAAVLEAFRRLAEYMAAEAVGAPGASRYSVNIGEISESISRHPAHMARALDNSGAADLLRPYRRV